jgi:hypothetical protein
MLRKIPSDIIGKQNRDDPACSAVLQTNAAPHASYYQLCDTKVLFTLVLQQV